MEYKKLSKKISFALRHSPESMGLKLDNRGFTSLDKLIKGINALGYFDKEITRDDIKYMMSIMEKKRFEIVGDKIRAFYGHSIDMVIKHAQKTPPPILYHGTAHKFVDSIMEKGLLPMGRQYVHLSEDIDVALAVGKRRDKRPVVYKILTKEATKLGIKFYVGNQDVWLTEHIPAALLIKVGGKDE